METLTDKFLQAVKSGDADTVLDCFWEDSKMISSEFPQMTYESYLPRVRPLLGTMNNLDYEIIDSSPRFISVLINIIIDDITLKYYMSARARMRNNVLKFSFIHFSPYPEEKQSALAWIAKKLADLENVGLLRDINRLELQREIVRLERENQQLGDWLDRSNNLMATGRVTALNRATNPPIFRLVEWTINQRFLIREPLLSELNLQDGVLIKVTQSRPVRQGRGKETQFWIVEQAERIEIADQGGR